MGTFRIPLARLQPFEEHIGRRLKINDEIGRRHVAREKVEQALVDEQLVVVEIEVGVNPIFSKM
jgi:hypothetical protein